MKRQHKCKAFQKKPDIAIEKRNKLKHNQRQYENRKSHHKRALRLPARELARALFIMRRTPVQFHLASIQSSQRGAWCDCQAEETHEHEQQEQQVFAENVQDQEPLHVELVSAERDVDELHRRPDICRKRRR
jgi:hypothetical protein